MYGLICDLSAVAGFAWSVLASLWVHLTCVLDQESRAKERIFNHGSYELRRFLLTGCLFVLN